VAHQTDFFAAKPPRFPRARRSDARSSHDAAAAIEASGAAKFTARRVVAFLRRFGEATSREIATYGHLDRYAVGRRMSELETAGMVERIAPRLHKPCGVTGKPAIHWRIKPAANAAPVLRDAA
jgi:hypothetical protein